MKVPSEIEIIDVCVEDDMSKMRFYNSDGLSKYYETKNYLKMKVRDREGEYKDYRKFTECTFDWLLLIK